MEKRTADVCHTADDSSSSSSVIQSAQFSQNHTDLCSTSPSLQLSSCVTFGRWPNLSELWFLIHRVIVKTKLGDEWGCMVARIMAPKMSLS